MGGVLLVALGAAVIVLRGGGDDDVLPANNERCGPKESQPRSALCPESETFDPMRYVRIGDLYDCSTFATQADAQAVLRADPGDRNRLDDNRDGIACPHLREPRDFEPVEQVLRSKCRQSDPRSARCPERWRRFDRFDHVKSQAGEFNCAYFASQADAQAVLRYQMSDPNDLDDDYDGIACPDLPGPKDRKPVPRPPKPAT
ncbi:MAG: hypothetical protein Q8O56_01095 [Solirubrobacteraceae bacterium]|nr:hypothetical protein [Solirubrobacteraceae bacterium]